MTAVLLVYAVLATLFTHTVHTLNLEQCDSALGMQSGSISDAQLSASSSHNINSVGPSSGRVRVEHRGGAWCPGRVITGQTHEFLQIDLGRVTVVTAAETQGRFGNGRGVEWAEHYSLQFWRPTLDGSSGWRTYRNGSGHSLLDGNVNTYLPHVQPLDPPIIASKVRVVPRATHPRTVCLRAELYGCPYIDDIEEYTMDAPDPRWPDLTYDGVRSGQVMERGLGQLTDGRRGTDDVTGAEWVGWKGSPGDRVNLRFQFSRPVLLEAVHVHISNRFTAGIRMFSMANLTFSMNGTRGAGSQSFTFRTERDNIFEDARQLTIPLYGHVARYVGLQLTLADTWLLLSEVDFVSDIASVNNTHPDVDSSLPDRRSGVVVSSRLPEHDDISKDTGSSASDGDHAEENSTHLTAVLVSVGVLLMAATAAVGYVLRLTHRRRVAGRGTTAGATLPLALSLGRKNGAGMLSSTGDRAGSWVRGAEISSDASAEEKRGLVDDMCRVVRLCERSRDSSTISRHNTDVTYEYAEPIYSMNVSPIYHVSSVPTGAATASWENPNYRETSTNTSADSSGSCSSSGGCNIADFLTLPSPPTAPPPLCSDISGALRPSRAAIAAAATVKSRRQRRVVARSVAGVTGTDVWTTSGNTADSSRCHVDTDAFDLIEKIADGRYSEIYVCQMKLTGTGDNEEVYTQPHSTRLATARVLRCAAPPELTTRLQQEADVLATACHRHVVRLLAVGALAEDRFVLVEHTEHGDLNRFLRVTACNNSARHRHFLSVEHLVNVASQLADGMSHLASLGIAHGDVATRNCLVTAHLDVKVGDLGPSRPEYASDYVTTPDGRVLPLRWRSPESLFEECHGTTAADVWSFGVLLWEILTWARLQPLGHLTDSAVVERLSSIRHTPSTTTSATTTRRACDPLLPPPPSCPDSLARLMTLCWHTQPACRPSFPELHHYLLHLSELNDISA